MKFLRVLSLVGGCALFLFRPCEGAGAERSGVVINEFVALNRTLAADEDGDRSDWIELHNRGSRPIALAGWGLTDAKNEPGKWRFPAVTLDAGGYLLVYASGKDRRDPAKPLHAGFKLKEKGDYLALCRPDGSVEQEFAPKYPDQKADVSYGFTEKGELDFLLRPTPGKSNGEIRLGRVDEVQFGVARGFHDAPFDLTLTSTTEGAQIRFTTDGSEPGVDKGQVYSGPMRVERTSVIRAAGFKTGYSGSRVATRTFLFPSDVIRQSADGLPPAGWQYAWGENAVDFGMDPKVVEDPRYKDRIIPALKSIPSWSVVMRLDDLFDAKTGIYANAGMDGRASERPASVEVIEADGSKGFQIDCGIRIRGGFSRMPANPKHAFRLFFRKEYSGTLKYPLFGADGAKEFENLDLRTFQNYSWSFQADPRGIFLRDQFNRDLQLAMGHPAARGDYCHLYINGVYWGLFNTCERPEASYGASYFGGAEEDYDVIKVNSGFNQRGMNPFGATTTDGDIEAWKSLWEQAKAGVADNARYFKLLGCNPDGTRNAGYPVLLDPVNLIDYMLVIFYGGNLDAPITKFGGDQRPNNWYGIRSRKAEHGFRYFVWDAEHTFLDLEEDRTGPFPAGDAFDASNPQWIWQQCLDNAEFRLLAADRVHRHFSAGGVLHPAEVARRLKQRAAGIEEAVIAESARWGDRVAGFPMGAPDRVGADGKPLKGPLNRDDDWRKEMNRVLTEFVPKRSDIVRAQLWKQGVLPDIEAPIGRKEAAGPGSGWKVLLESKVGVVHSTADGTDPRQVGGKVASGARVASGPVEGRSNGVVKARVLLGDEWSALTEVAVP